MKFDFIPIKTRIVSPPKDNIDDIFESIDLKDGDIIFITSKILGIAEGRCFATDKFVKEDLIAKEADRYLKYTNKMGGFQINLSVNQGILIPAAGIDESNTNGYYVLWPKDPDKTCREIRNFFIKKFGVKNLGVVMTDSHSTPLRWGVTGFSIGIAGVNPLEDMRETEDLFGRKMHITQINKIDPLASMAVALMGECSESTPIVILRGYTNIQFSDSASMEHLKIKEDLDLYYPLIKAIPPSEINS